MKTSLVFTIVFLISCLITFSQDRVNYTVRYKPFPILDSPGGKVLTKVARNETISISSYNIECDCFPVRYLDFEGIILPETILDDVLKKPSGRNNGDDSVDLRIRRLLTEYRLANDNEPDGLFTITKSDTQTGADTKRKIDLIGKWGYTNGKRIAERKIWIGMTADMALESWGIPYRINRNHGNWGMREQWIYSEAYLYFENGVLAEIFKVASK